MYVQQWNPFVSLDPRLPFLHGKRAWYTCNVPIKLHVYVISGHTGLTGLTGLSTCTCADLSVCQSNVEFCD